jgi:hypothetical protein
MLDLGSGWKIIDYYISENKDIALITLNHNGKTIVSRLDLLHYNFIDVKLHLSDKTITDIIYYLNHRND